MKKSTNLPGAWLFAATMAVFGVGSAASLSAGPIVANGDFETGASAFTASPGYIGGSNPAQITGWTASGTGSPGINPGAGAGNPFNDNGNDSTNVAFLQANGGNTTTLSQSISGFSAGATYVVNYNYNARNCCGDNPNLVTSIGSANTTISNIQPVVNLAGGASNPYYSVYVPFTATGTTQTLSFTATGHGSDATALLDNVKIQRVTMASISNPSFEANSNPGVGYGPINGWTFTTTGTNQAGTNPGASGNFFIPGRGGANATPPDGNQVAFIQDAGTLSQTVSGLTPGVTYTLSFFDGHRFGDSGPGDTLTTIIGGTTLGTDTPNVNEYTPITYSFLATSSSELLQFVHGNVTGDQSIALDDVAIFTTTVPEPSSIIAVRYSGWACAGLAAAFVVFADGGPGSRRPFFCAALTGLL